MAALREIAYRADALPHSTCDHEGHIRVSSPDAGPCVRRRVGYPLANTHEIQMEQHHVTCSSCGAPNQSGRKFCGECGASLSVACPSCGAANEPRVKFCGECGSNLVPSSPAARSRETGGDSSRSSSATVAERRVVTVLFADLVGFTVFAEGRDPEETRELLSRYFDLATDVIGRYGGAVEKFIGDAVMAVWGAPTAREDDAERAVRAALELVDAVPALAPGTQARAGVLTGEAAVTLGAIGQGMVAGDLVNTASRLQGAAVPGTVLVGEATHRAASRAIVFEEAGDQTLKGKTAPVPSWRALRVVAERGGRNRSETLEAPFVGRQAELRLLKDLFHATARERRARLISVVGPAGIGKTRLGWEFLKYIDGLVDPVWWHDGRSPAYGDGITFWALGEMIRARCALLETDDEATTRAKVTETLAAHVPEEGDRRWIEPALLALLGFGSGVASEQLFGAWRTFFERLAATAPVVLVFEDFHFADSGLLDFVDHLMEWSRNVPLYVLTLARPELHEKRAGWGAGTRNFTSLYLEPLAEPAMRELLSGLVPGLPESAVHAIVARADGIPLYAVETVRMLLAEGKLELRDGGYVPVGDLADLAVPESLTAIIASRLDGLTPEDRSLVQDAAVLGQSFTVAGLTAVSGVTGSEIESRLRALVRREILAVEADPRSPERGQYAFVQALIREVAYNTLARADRKNRHLAAARFFETLGTDELAGAQAGHYLAARANAPDGPERDALAAQARVALKGAAERAANLGAHEQAVAFLEQALTVATDPVDRARLLERAGQSAAIAAHMGSAEAFLRDALAIHDANADRTGVARVTAALGRVLISGRHLDDGLALLEPASMALADLFPDPAVVALQGQLARAYMLHEEPRRAIEVADRVLEAAEHGNLAEILADALVTKGTALTSLGRLNEGTGVIEIGEKIARARGFTETLLRALNNRSGQLIEFEPRAFLENEREGLELARRVGNRAATFGFLAGIGWFEVLSGDAESALATWESGLAEESDSGDRLALLHGILWVRILRGEETTDLFTEMDRLSAKVSDPRMADTDDEHAWLALLAGRLSDARRGWRATAAATADNALQAYLQAARAALWDGDAAGAAADLAAIDATGVQTPITELRRQGIRAGLAALDGRSDEALGLYRQVLRGWRDTGFVWEEALVAMDMATLLDPTDDEVRAAAERARETLTRLGATPFIALLKAATARPRSRQPARRVAPAPDFGVESVRSDH